MNFHDPLIYPALFTLFFAYIIGAIPTGLLLSKVFKTKDLRKIGSGNIGATNALRTGNKTFAALTLLGDVAKGAIALSLIKDFMPNITPELFYGAALAAIIGHIYPFWLGFKGGKGVATTFGILLVTFPSLALFAAVIWLAIAFTFKYSSLSALTAAVLIPVLAKIFMADVISQAGFQFLGVVTLVIIFTHRENIRRLMKGKEGRIGQKS